MYLFILMIISYSYDLLTLHKRVFSFSYGNLLFL